MATLCITEEKYKQLIGSLQNEAEVITRQLQERDKYSDTPIVLQNIQFELKILLHALTDFIQYEEEHQTVMLNLSEQNKNRLIGFLLEKL